MLVLCSLSNKARFILAVIKGEVKVNNVKRNIIIARLEELGFDKFATKSKSPKSATPSDDSDNDEEKSDGASYDYLLRMPIWSLTKEKVFSIVRFSFIHELFFFDLFCTRNPYMIGCIGCDNHDC